MQFISLLDDTNLFFKMQIICKHSTPFEAYPLQTTELKGHAYQTRCLLDREPCRLFISRGPTCLTPHVDLSSHQYPKYGLLAGFGWGFHPNIILSRQKKIHLYVTRSKD